MRPSTWISCFVGASAAAAGAAATPAGRAAAEAEVPTDAHAARCAVLQARRMHSSGSRDFNFHTDGASRISLPGASCRALGAVQHRSIALGPSR